MEGVTVVTASRKPVSYRLDERVQDAIRSISVAERRSANNWLENALIQLLMKEGYLGGDFVAIGERRGGDRRSAKVKAEASHNGHD